MHTEDRPNKVINQHPIFKWIWGWSGSVGGGGGGGAEGPPGMSFKVIYPVWGVFLGVC